MFWVKENVVIYAAILSVSSEYWYSAVIDKPQDRKVEFAKGIIDDRPKYFKQKYVSIINEDNTTDQRKYAERITLYPVIEKSPDITTIRNIYTTDDIANKEKGDQGVWKFSGSRYKKNNIFPRNKYPKISQWSNQNSNGTSKSRFLEVFQVVDFDHASCTSSNGMEGICLPKHTCNSNGGSIMGVCADGYGVCCINVYTCDSSTSVTKSWFTNPEFPLPSSARLSCTFTVNKASDEIKQIRLDFLAFEILPPTAGNCQQDQFIISGQNLNSIVPILCGINSGQHVYLDVSDVDGPFRFSVQTATADSRIFSIKVSQLISTDDVAAPTGCLQYYRDSEGFLTSFNYRDTSDIAPVRIPSYTNNLNYAICIKRAAESCSVTYTTAGDMQIVNYDTDGLPIIPPNQAGVEIYNCPSDYLLMSATRLCGERLNDGSVLEDFSLNAPITDNSAGPIVVWFRSDEGYTGRGFKLKYQQNACNTPDYK